jgi:nucleotide-binding universal stress UspA family protein
MGCIVCATRGGAGSRATQLRGIRLAARDGSRLVFLLVVDSGFMGEVDPSLETAVAAELRWVGQTLLSLAMMRAADADVRADAVIREGNARDEIEQFLAEADADLLLLGAPRSATDSVFGDDPVERFAEALTDATGVRADVVYPEGHPEAETDGD